MGMPKSHLAFFSNNLEALENSDSGVVGGFCRLAEVATNRLRN